MRKEPQQSLKVSERNAFPVAFPDIPSLLSGNKCTFIELIGAPQLRTPSNAVEKIGFDFGVSWRFLGTTACAAMTQLRRDAEVSGSLKFGSSGSSKWTSLLPFKASKKRKRSAGSLHSIGTSNIGLHSSQGELSQWMPSTSMYCSSIRPVV